MYKLGSGVRKITQYAEAYAGSQPILTDSDIFRLERKTNLFQDVKSQEQDSSITVTDKASDKVLIVLEFCKIPRTLFEIMAETGYSSKAYFLKTILQPLINEGRIERIFV